MKLHILSDLHLEFDPFPMPSTDADIVVLAGDIDLGTGGLAWAMNAIRKPVIYVPGNHEFYFRHMNKTAIEMREIAAGSGNIHLLDNDEVIIDGVRFLGCTLWTNFELFGSDPSVVGICANLAGNGIADFQRNIRYGTAWFSVWGSVFLHNTSVEWLEQKLQKDFDGPTVVVTHHLPSRRSVAARYAEDMLSAAFASDLDRLMGKAALWIHGHTHDSFDYVLNGTRVVCNPRGYCKRGVCENAEFDPELILEIDSICGSEG